MKNFLRKVELCQKIQNSLTQPSLANKQKSAWFEHANWCRVFRGTDQWNQSANTQFFYRKNI